MAGGDEFYRLSKALKDAGRLELRKELNKGLRTAAKPLIKDTRAEALATLPKRGGLNRVVARAPQRVRVRTGAATAGVQVVVAQKAGSGARGANAGSVRHPVFGDRSRFVAQRVRPGWFDRPLQQGAPKVRPELQAAIERTLEQVARGVR